MNNDEEETRFLKVESVLTGLEWILARRKNLCIYCHKEPAVVSGACLKCDHVAGDGEEEEEKQ